MTLQEIEKTLAQGISSITGKDLSQVSPETSFQDIGVDSLGFVEILVFIEKKFNLQLISTDLTRNDFESIHRLALLISKTL